jgi:hypothetical protein
MRTLMILLLIGLFVTSCQKELPDPIVVNSFDSEFKIIPWQHLNPVKSDFNLIIQSETLQDCDNSELNAEILFDQNVVNIQINGVVQSEPCNAGQAFAQTTLPLDMAPGLYDLNVNLGSTIINHGTIEIQDEQFKMELTENTGIALVQDSLLRIEEGLSWGFVDDRLNPIEVASEINNSIFEEIPLVTTVREGNYGHFEVGDLNSIIIADSPDDVTGVLLDMRQPGSWQRLKVILTEYELKYPNLQYRFTRWDGLEIWN